MALPSEPQFPGQLIDHYDAIDAHLANSFPEAEITYYEEQQHLGFRLDVFRIRPLGVHYQILLTSGLSTVPMIVPDEIENPRRFQYAELMMVLPASWPLSDNKPDKPENDWPVTTLKQMARLPLQEKAFLAEGQTIQYDEYYRPYHKSVGFVGCLLVAPVTLADTFKPLMTSHGTINFYSAFPLYQRELFYTQRYGYAAFRRLLELNEVYEIMHPQRVCLVE